MAVDNYQPSLAISELVQTTGPFPGSVANEGDLTMGMVRMFAGNYAWDGSAFASGQVTAVSGNTPLFSLFGSTYGGNGGSTFGFPDLQGTSSIGIGQGTGLSPYSFGDETGQAEIDLAVSQVPAQWGGSNQPVNNVQPSLAINYLIRVSGDDAGVGSDGNADFLGGIVKYLADTVIHDTPPGYLLANGQLLDKDDYPDLFALIGFTYGGDDNELFALPDLESRIPVGGTLAQVGTQLGAEQPTITPSQIPTTMGGGGSPISNYSPSLVLRYIICTDPTAPYPSRSGATGASPADAHLGEIMLYAGTGALPPGWVLCDGTTLPIAGNAPLFSIIGTSYGGNGQTTFRLPDFAGKTDIGYGQSAEKTFDLGVTYGTEEHTLTTADMPNLNFTGTTGNDMLLGGGDGNDTIDGLAGNDSIVGNGGHDSLIGGDGADSIEGSDGNDTILGGGGDDTITGGGGVDSLIGGSGSDTFIMVAEDDIGDTIDGGADPGIYDTLSITAPGTYDFTGVAITNIDILDLSGDGAPWTIILSDSLLATVNTAGGQLLINAISDFGFTLDASAVSASYGFFLTGALLGDDSITGGAGRDYIKTATGSDTIDGGGGNDEIDGGADADSLNGGDGDDAFDIWGASNLDGDTIDGGSGSDRLLLRQMFDGDYDFSGKAISHVEEVLLVDNMFAWTVTLSNLMVTTAEYGGAGSHTLRVAAHLSNLTHTVTIDGSALDAAQHLIVDGARFLANDTITGGAGDDSLYGGAGADSIVGGDGDDTINGGAGGDSLFGGEGNDTFVAGVLSDLVNDTVDGGDGVDTLEVGPFSYTLDGTYTRIDAVRLTAGGATVTVMDAMVATAEFGGRSGVLGISSLIEMNVGVTINATGLTGARAIAVDGRSWGEQDDFVYGGAGNDTINGGLGSNTLIGYGGINTLDYSFVSFALTVDTMAGTAIATNDAGLLADGFNDFVVFVLGSGNDLFTGSTLGETIDGGDGADTIDGADGNDQITGGAGIDSLIGGDGADTFVLSSAADLADTIDGLNDANSLDSLRLDTAGTYDFTGKSIAGIEQIVLNTDGANWQIVVTDQLAGSADGSFLRVVAGNTVTLTHGVLIDATALANGRLLEVDGTLRFNGDDTFLGGAGRDRLESGAGNDVISGGDGADSITGGAGADSVSGGAGYDTFIYESAAELSDGHGHFDTIDGGAGDALVSLYGSGAYDFTGVAMSRVSDIELNGAITSLTLIDITGVPSGKVFVGGGPGVTFSTGVRIDASAFTSAGLSFDGSTFDGNDTIIGGAGNDKFLLGAGVDSVVGGAGADIFEMADAAALASIIDAGHGTGVDVLQLDSAGSYDFDGAEITGIDSIRLRNNAADWTLLLTDALVASAEYDEPSNLEIGATHSLSHGVTIDASSVAAPHFLSIAGANFDGDDSVVAGAGDDVIETGEGDDTVDSGAGDDTVEAGLGTQSLSGGDGVDELSFSNIVWDLDIVADPLAGTALDFATLGNNVSTSFSGFEVYVLGEGHDSFLGSSSSETITGGEGDDTIDGRGGTADRVVYAHDWKDYSFSENAGVITVTGVEGTDVISNVEFFEFEDGVLATAAQVLNDKPIAGDDAADITEPTGTPGVLTASGNVLTNDTDADEFLGDSFKVIAARVGPDTDPGQSESLTNGTVTIGGIFGDLTIEEDGSYTYTLSPSLMGAVKGGETAHDVFIYVIDDLHGSRDVGQIDVTITETNDAPTGADKTIAVDEDSGPFTFTASDFGFADSDGNSLQSVIITSLPAAGTLKLNGVTVTANQTIAAAAIGTLVFTPALNANGSPYGSFGFKVVDNGGTANGGSNTDAVANIIRFDVTGVNDAPVISSNGGEALAVTVAENSAAAVADVDASDVESSVSYSLTGADAQWFDISSTGVVTFKYAPDYETPEDAGANNTYDITVVASDGDLADTQQLVVTVTNLKGNTINGTSGNDTIDATHKINKKGATSGEDKIDGKAGNDKLGGAAGNDTLIGGTGNDTLDGGNGADTFVFNAKLSATSNVDTIKAFTHDADIVELSKAIFGKIGATLTAGEFYAKAGAIKAHDKDDRIIYDKKTGKLFYDDDGNKKNGHDAVHFATLSNKPAALDVHDFIIV